MVFKGISSKREVWSPTKFESGSLNSFSFDLPKMIKYFVEFFSIFSNVGSYHHQNSFFLVLFLGKVKHKQFEYYFHMLSQLNEQLLTIV